jgi:hypothetical protein
MLHRRIKNSVPSALGKHTEEPGQVKLRKGYKIEKNHDGNQDHGPETTRSVSRYAQRI